MAEMVLVRHGETEGQSSIRLNGATDVALSGLGREQMARAASALAGEQFDIAVASPLVRSKASLEIALAGAGPPIRVVRDFREVNFGRWETLTWAEAAAQDPAEYERCKTPDRECRFPGGESRIGFYQRVEAAAHRELDHLDGRTLCALHKGVTKIIIGTLCRLSWDEYRALPCDLGSIHRLERQHNGWRLATSNQVAHLGNTWLQDHP